AGGRALGIDRADRVTRLGDVRYGERLVGSERRAQHDPEAARVDVVVLLLHEAAERARVRRGRARRRRLGEKVTGLTTGLGAEPLVTEDLDRAADAGPHR